MSSGTAVASHPGQARCLLSERAQTNPVRRLVSNSTETQVQHDVCAPDVSDCASAAAVDFQCQPLAGGLPLQGTCMLCTHAADKPTPYYVLTMDMPRTCTVHSTPGHASSQLER